MFDWLGDILAGLGEAIAIVFEGTGAEIAGAIWDALVTWIYNAIYGAVADLFTGMNSMGAEIFNLGWVQAVVELFALFGWTLYVTGVVMVVFDLAIESNSGRVNVKTVAINAFKGFFACALVGVLPVELYKFCVSLQNTFAGDLIQIFAGTQVGTLGETAAKVLELMFNPLAMSGSVLKLLFFLLGLKGEYHAKLYPSLQNGSAAQSDCSIHLPCGPGQQGWHLLASDSNYRAGSETV